MPDWIEPGAAAPDFSLKAHDGAAVTLSDFRGKPVVLYFYPKDDTPGCTKEACAFRDRKGEIESRSAVILGVSPDDVASHAAFRAKHKLNFTLLADPDHKVAEKYGAWREKNRYGRKGTPIRSASRMGTPFMGVQRSTFLIDPEGKVVKVWKSVRVDGHDEQVVAALDELDGRK